MTRRRRRVVTAGLIVLGAAVAVLVAAYSVVRARLFPGRYRAAVSEAAEEAGLDRLLVASVVHCESRFRPGARSAAGARGLMQLMPSTAAEVAASLELDGYTEAGLDEPALNLRLGCGYLADLLERFGGDEAVALAAYNAGPAKVAAWLEAAGGDGERMLEEHAFPETRRYVRDVLRTRRLLARLEAIDAF